MSSETSFETWFVATCSKIRVKTSSGFDSFFDESFSDEISCLGLWGDDVVTSSSDSEEDSPKTRSFLTTWAPCSTRPTLQNEP